MKSLQFNLTALFISVLLMAGCGQKGPLFLPDEKELSEEQQQERDEQLKEIEQDQAPTQY